FSSRCHCYGHSHKIRKEWLFRRHEKCGVDQRTNGIQIGENQAAELLVTRDKISRSFRTPLLYRGGYLSAYSARLRRLFRTSLFSRTSARPQSESISLSCKKETMLVRTRNSGAKVQNASHSRPPMGSTRTKFALFSIA